GTHFTYEVTGLPEFDGTYYVRAFAYDPAGKNRSAGAGNITVDTTPPVVTVNTVARGLLSGTVTFGVTGTDDNLAPGRPNTWVYLYNHLPPQKQKGASINFASGFNTFTVDTTLLDDGLASLNVGKLKDAAGNWSGVKDNYFSKYVIDNTAPEMPIHLSPANN